MTSLARGRGLAFRCRQASQALILYDIPPALGDSSGAFMMMRRGSDVDSMDGAATEYSLYLPCPPILVICCKDGIRGLRKRRIHFTEMTAKCQDPRFRILSYSLKYSPRTNDQMLNRCFIWTTRQQRNILSWNISNHLMIGINSHSADSGVAFPNIHDEDPMRICHQ